MSNSEGQQGPPDEPVSPAPGALASCIPPQELTRLRAELVRAVSRVCPSWLADRADDLVQVALIRVAEIYSKRQEASMLSFSYLRKAAYSAVVDEIRRLRRRQEVPLIEEGAEVHWPSGVPDPERHAASRETGRAIRDCLQRLIAPRRSAVTLHLQGHSVPDLARLLGWSAKRAENLVYRGMADLRACLELKGIGA